jgi:hypothetical protein
MADIDSIWAEMNISRPCSAPSAKPKKAKEAGKSKDPTLKQKAAAAAAAAILKPSAAPAPPKTTKMKKKKEEEDGEQQGSAGAVVALKYEEMKEKIHRDVQLTADENGVVRRKALQRLQKTLFEEHTMSDEDYGLTLRHICESRSSHTNLFKRFADSVEKCRELSLKIIQLFFERSSDLQPVLEAFFPALMLRLPRGLAYDDDMKVFITDLEGHEEFRRGKAVERQDKGTSFSFTVRELEC